MKALASVLRRALVPTLSVVTALLLGGVVIILTDFDNLSKIGHGPGRARSSARSAAWSTATARCCRGRSAIPAGS